MGDLGFRRKGRGFRVDLEANWEGVVRLRTAQAADGVLRVGELISVLYLPLIEWGAQHSGHRSHATFQLQGVTPNINCWRMNNQLLGEGRARAYAEALIGLTRDTILPWMRETARLDVLLDPKSNGLVTPGYGKHVDRAVATALSGESAVAADFLRATVTDIDDKFPDHSDWIRDTARLVADEFGQTVEVPGAPIGRQPRDGSVPINTSSEGIRLDLYHYGEDDLAEQSRHLTADQNRRICEVAGTKVFEDGALLLAKQSRSPPSRSLRASPRPRASATPPSGFPPAELAQNGYGCFTTDGADRIALLQTL